MLLLTLHYIGIPETWLLLFLKAGDKRHFANCPCTSWGYKMQQFIDIALRRSPYKLNRVYILSLSRSLCVFAFLLLPNVDVAVDPCGRFLLLLLLLAMLARSS